ncbi:sensor histidine kinase [Mucilaginibacter antarcticus]|uniref:sensor histidine kinase n=1 Tax=Mucilaginibacter antarcticus TaxID=1855725 RepID=UPI00364547D3
MLVNITDSGIGISPEDMPFIFNRFKKFRQSMQQDSFGLGLPIVKSIAAFHRIKIDVDSAKDLGSNFKLTLPADMLASQE